MPTSRALSPVRRAPAAPSALAALAAVLVGVLLVLLAGVGPASAAEEDAADGPPAPAPGAAWFGPGLDWTVDLPQEYADRLDGVTPSSYEQRVHYPLTDDDATYLDQFAQQTATQGAVAVLTLEPQVALDDLDAADAERLADELARVNEKYDSLVLVRFAPEMNGSWVIWGQQPAAYREAFTTVADAVHERLGDDGPAAMVWSPAYGAGYPYDEAYGDLDPTDSSVDPELDTDGDGALTDADDPYGPYYPGDDAVDWVGESLFYFGGDRQRFAGNRAPEDGEYAARLEETWGYGAQVERESFYDRYAREDRPMLVETGALYAPDNADAPGAVDELTIKQDWWRQVFAEQAERPLVAGITWVEVARREAEADDAVVEWGATRTPELADALAADLAAAVDDGSLDLGPVTRVLDQAAGNAATAQGRDVGPQQAGAEMGWIVFCAAALAVLFVLAGAAGRFLPSWRYPEDDRGRDQRIDLLRGMVILTVVFTHIELGGPYTYVSLNAIGAITGAEMFVLLSGIVLGMVYAPSVRKLGEWATAVVMWRRAVKQYVVALVVVLLVWVLGLIPFVDATDITTFTDRGTGTGGSADVGQVYDLYANAPRLLDYPPPWYAVRQLLLLEMGPWVFNIMGLFVVLSLALPAMMWLVRRGLWWVLLAVSWGLYVVQAVYEPMVLPSQFEAVFPLLTWQVAFTHGLVVGHYRARVTRALTTRPGKAATTVFVVGYAGSLVWLWAAHRLGLPPVPFPDGSYQWLYENAYVRVFLQPGRLVDLVLVVVVAFAVLTTCWKPIDKAVGWFWTPLGSASLYVFIVHVFFALAVGNIPGLDRTSWWQGAVIHTVVALVIWWMVRRKFLFSVIPR